MEGKGMTQKKNAQPHKNAELSATDTGRNPTSIKCMTPRQKRVTKAMVQSNGWITREAIDRIAGASNGPEVIANCAAASAMTLSRWSASVWLTVTACPPSRAAIA